jgi:hypothetical protein
MDADEMLAHDGQAALGQQEMHVGHAAMLAVLDGDDRTVGAAILDRIQRVLETETGQRRARRIKIQRRPVRIAPGAP